MSVMAAKVKSLIRSWTAPTTPKGCVTAKHPQDLFTTTSAAVDGEECLHDCDSCTIRLPSKWSIDESDQLYGHVNGWDTHILVATGKTDWVRDVADEKGSIMEALGKSHVKPSNGKLKVSASNIPIPDEPDSQPDTADAQAPTSVLLLPAFTIIENVTPSSIPDLVTGFINIAPTNTSPLFPSALAKSDPSTPLELRSRPCPHKYLILLCSQRTRDARCGQSAPLLRREFERHLRPLGLYRDAHDERPGGVGIYFISHVGGHKYSANIMIYRRADTVDRSEPESRTSQDQSVNDHGSPFRECFLGDCGASQCIWLARVRPEDCENIVRYTILQGKVVKPERQLRGGFDRARGLVSW